MSKYRLLIPKTENVIARIKSQQYPTKLFVFERKELLIDVDDVEAFLKAHPKIKEMAYLAYVEQFQRYNDSFAGDQTQDYALKKGDEFNFSYINDPLVFRRKEVEPTTLANVIELRNFGLASRIEDVRGGYFVKDKSGSIEDTLATIFLRAMTEWGPECQGANEKDWQWQKNYPHLSIATVSLPKFTDEIKAAGRKIGAETHVYKERRT